jgi:hypothetical protein
MRKEMERGFCFGSLTEPDSAMMYFCLGGGITIVLGMRVSYYSKVVEWRKIRSLSQKIK